MRLNTIIILGLLFSIQQFVWGQEAPISLTNPSFEDMPRHSKPPRAWSDCGFPGESPPDIQPSGTFHVTRPAYDGSTYLGMVVRDNDTWESVAQRLSEPMKAGTCYNFSISLSRSELYVSTSRITQKDANYTTPAKLRIWGGFGHCDKQYLLAETSTIEHTSWKTYELKLNPVADYSYIILEAFYKTPTLFPYNGNILIDNASDITPCDEIVYNEPKPVPPVPAPPRPQEKDPEPQKPKNPEPKKPKTEDPVVVNNGNNEEEGPKVKPEPPKPKPPKPKSFEDLTIESIAVDDVIPVDQLFFDANKYLIKEQSYPALDKLHAFLIKYPKVVIEIGGHTNNIPSHAFCDQLSTNRAREVAKYLFDKGISMDRLKYKGYGKRKPVADNSTREGREKNQRVEIKFLSLEG